MNDRFEINIKALKISEQEQEKCDRLRKEYLDNGGTIKVYQDNKIVGEKKCMKEL